MLKTLLVFHNMNHYEAFARKKNRYCTSLSDSFRHLGCTHLPTNKKKKKTEINQKSQLTGTFPVPHKFHTHSLHSLSLQTPSF